MEAVQCCPCLRSSHFTLPVVFDLVASTPSRDIDGECAGTACRNRASGQADTLRASSGCNDAIAAGTGESIWCGHDQSGGKCVSECDARQR